MPTFPWDTESTAIGTMRVALERYAHMGCLWYDKDDDGPMPYDSWCRHEHPNEPMEWCYACFSSEALRVADSKEKAEPPEPYRCPKCKGTNLEMPMWVNLNTGVVGSDYCVSDYEVYCNDCDEHTNAHEVFAQKEG